MLDFYGHIGASLLASFFIDESDLRWIEYDSNYERMWKDMSKTMDSDLLEEKLRRMEKYVYDKAHALFIYSPLTLYAVNKQISLVPQEFGYLGLKETSVTENHWSIPR
jgi:hypothetical protein